MEILQSIITGLVSGCISSWLVTSLFKKKEEQALEMKQFLADQQEYLRYLQRIRTQMAICFHNRENADYSALIMEIENAPIVESFERLTEEEKEILHEAAEAIMVLRQCAETGDAGEPHVYYKCSSKLLQCCVAVLKFKSPPN